MTTSKKLNCNIAIISDMFNITTQKSTLLIQRVHHLINEEKKLDESCINHILIILKDEGQNFENKSLEKAISRSTPFFQKLSNYQHFIINTYIKNIKLLKDSEKIIAEFFNLSTLELDFLVTKIEQSFVETKFDMNATTEILIKIYHILREIENKRNLNNANSKIQRNCYRCDNIIHHGSYQDALSVENKILELYYKDFSIRRIKRIILKKYRLSLQVDMINYTIDKYFFKYFDQKK